MSEAAQAAGGPAAPAIDLDAPAAPAPVELAELEQGSGSQYTYHEDGGGLDKHSDEGAPMSMIPADDTVSRAPLHESLALRRFVSVRSATTLLCLLCVLATGAVIYVLSRFASDDALDQTRGAGDTALEQCFGTAEKSTRVQTQLVMYTGVSTVSQLMLQFLENQRLAAKKLVQRLHTMPPDDLLEWTTVYELRKELWAALETMKGYGSFSFGVTTGNGHTVVIFQSTSEGWSEMRTIINDGSNMSVSIAGPTLAGDGAIVPEELDKLFAALAAGKAHSSPAGFITLNPTTASWFQLARLLSDGDAKWGPITGVSSVFVGSILVHRVPQPGSREGFAVVAGAVDLRIIGAYLRSLVDRMSDPAESRLFTVVASSWVAHQLGINGTDYAREEGYDQEHILTGVSHGDSFIVVQGTDPITGDIGNLSYPLPDYNATDYQIRKIVEAIGGRYAEFENASNLKEITIDGTRHFAQAERLQNQYGTDWRMVMTISRKAVMERVDAAQQKTQQEIEASETKVARGIQEKRYQLLGITVAVAIVLLAVSVYFAHRIVTPIVLLRRDMKFVATMNLDAVEERPLSALAEVRDMQESFKCMIEFLHEYRSYIPTSLLQQDEKKGFDEVDPPQGGVIAIVFTDIEGSTSLWDAAPDAMNIAIDVHNSCMREQLRKFRGYEVKTIGDSFMVAFSSPADAAQFAIGVQAALAAAEWPADLGRPPEGKAEGGGPLWSGIRVRVGAHCGEAIAEENPLTGRTDYRGTTVNKAARVEARARGGTVCVTSELLAAIASDLPRIGNPAVVDYGTHTLKGLPGESSLHLMLPASLKGRFVDMGLMAGGRRRSGETDRGSQASVDDRQRTDTASRHSYNQSHSPQHNGTGDEVTSSMRPARRASFVSIPSRQPDADGDMRSGRVPSFRSGSSRGSRTGGGGGGSVSGGSNTGGGTTPGEAHLGWSSCAPVEALSISIVRAFNCVPMDSGRTSDPYVCIELLQPGQQQRRSSRTNVQRSTLNPEWHETFVMKVSDPERVAREGIAVCFTVFDWDRFSSDDFMGFVQLQLSVADIAAAAGLAEGMEKQLKLGPRPDNSDDDSVMAKANGDLGSLVVRVLPHLAAQRQEKGTRTPPSQFLKPNTGGGGGGRRRGVAAPAKPAATGLQLRHGDATVCLLHLRDAGVGLPEPQRMSAACNSCLRCTAELALQTDGTVEHVAGREILLTWNAGAKPSKNHYVAGLRFAALTSKRVSTERLNAGLGTGAMLHGNVGTAKQRFRTVVGRALSAASACADYAEVLGTFCLLADCTLDSRLRDNTTVQGMVRPVDRWLEVTDGQVMDVYEVLCERLLSALEGAWAADEGSTDETRADDVEYRRRFAVAATDPGALERLSEVAPQDVVLRRVVQEMRHWRTGKREVRFTHQSLPFVSSGGQGGAEHQAPARPMPPLQPRQRRLSRSSVGDSCGGDRLPPPVMTPTVSPGNCSITPGYPQLAAATSGDMHMAFPSPAQGPRLSLTSPDGTAAPPARPTINSPTHAPPPPPPPQPPPQQQPPCSQQRVNANGPHDPPQPRGSRSGSSGAPGGSLCTPAALPGPAETPEVPALGETLGSVATVPAVGSAPARPHSQLSPQPPPPPPPKQPPPQPPPLPHAPTAAAAAAEAAEGGSPEGGGPEGADPRHSIVSLRIADSPRGAPPSPAHRGEGAGAQPGRD